MAEIDPELSLSNQLRKIRLDQLAKNTAELSQNFSRAGSLSKISAIQMLANISAMRAQTASLHAQIRSDQVELRLKRQRLGLINSEVGLIQQRIRIARAEAESIATRGRTLRGRFAGASDLATVLEQVDELKNTRKKLLGRREGVNADISGLTEGISSKQFGMKMLKFELIAQAAQTVASALTDASNALSEFIQKIYTVQQRLSVQMGTATQLQLAAIRSSIASYFSFDKPTLSSEEIIAAQEAFKREFGTILAPEEQERIASESKRLGITADVYTRARRAFLGTGSAEASRMAAMNEFAKQGLSAGAALQFAADNANLVAIAGEKYADSLFRAAAESKKIGVDLANVDKFSNSIVGDFEGAVANFAELSALGVDLDVPKIFATAQFGTLEEKQNLLQEQFSQAKITGEELQRNTALRLALTQATGMDESTILRLAGVAQAPTEQTIQEKQYDTLSKMLEVLTKIAKGFSIIGQILATAVGGAVAGAGIGFLFGGPAGATLGAAIGGGVGLIGGIMSTAGGMIGMQAGGLVRGPGTSTSDSVPAMLSNGEYVLNAETVRNIGVSSLDAVNRNNNYLKQPFNINLPRKMKDGGLVTINGTNQPPNQPPKKPTVEDNLNQILGKQDMAKIAFYIVREKLMTGNLASSLGVSEDFKKTKQILDTPFAKEIFEITGDSEIKPGVFYPKSPEITNMAFRLLNERKKKGEVNPELENTIMRLFTIASENGFYNPVNGRISFPRDLAPNKEHDAILAVGAMRLYDQKLNKHKDEILSEVFERYTAANRKYIREPLNKEFPGYNVETGEGNSIARQRKSQQLEKLKDDVNHPMGQISLERDLLVDLNKDLSGRDFIKSPDKNLKYYLDSFKKAYEYLKQTESIDNTKMIDLMKISKKQPLVFPIAKFLLGSERFAKHPLADYGFTEETFEELKENQKERSKRYKKVKKFHEGGLVHGSDEVPAMLKSGEYVINPKATSMYGTEFLNNINAGVYAQQPSPVVNNNVTVNNDALRGELRQLVSSIRDMRIEMNGYDVGHVALNESRTPLRTL